MVIPIIITEPENLDVNEGSSNLEVDEETQETESYPEARSRLERQRTMDDYVPVELSPA